MREKITKPIKTFLSLIVSSNPTHADLILTVNEALFIFVHQLKILLSSWRIFVLRLCKFHYAVKDIINIVY